MRTVKLSLKATVRQMTKVSQQKNDQHVSVKKSRLELISLFGNTLAWKQPEL